MNIDDKEWREKLLSGKIDKPYLYASYVLPKVSRTFALNISILPEPLKEQVLVAYLFCRMADTLEDDEHLSPDEKVKLLALFEQLFDRHENPNDSLKQELNFQQNLPASWQTNPNWDSLITFHCFPIFGLYRKFSPKSQMVIAIWVKEMIHGMIQYTKLQGLPSFKGFLIKNPIELDNYCYYVAGTVGRMLCELFYIHSFHISLKRKAKLESLSISFGLALQMTNILKDIQDDKKRNISFIPLSLLEEKPDFKTSLKSRDLQNIHPGIMKDLISQTQIHLLNALSYIRSLPVLEPRIRLFCLWPLFMAMDSLILISISAGHKSGQIQAAAKPKITRKQVLNIVKITGFICWSNWLIQKFFEYKMTKLNESLKDLK